MASDVYVVTRRTVLIGASVLTGGCITGDSGEDQDTTEDGSDESSDSPSKTEGSSKRITASTPSNGGFDVSRPSFFDDQ